MSLFVIDAIDSVAHADAPVLDNWYSRMSRLVQNKAKWFSNWKVSDGIVSKSVDRISKKHYWPKMRSDVADLI